MTRRITLAGVVLLGVCAIVGASAVSVSAVGHEFVASATGKTKGEGVTIQRLKTGAGLIECATVAGSGEITGTKSETHKEVLTFSNCTGFSNKVKVTPADFQFNANGPAKLENTVEIKPENLSCEVFVEPQTVESLSYEGISGGKLKSVASITKIKAKGTGGTCGGNTEATYTGTIDAELEGGTLEWK